VGLGRDVGTGPGVGPGGGKGVLVMATTATATGTDPVTGVADRASSSLAVCSMTAS
jgi:hypothetical protein